MEQIYQTMAQPRRVVSSGTQAKFSEFEQGMALLKEAQRQNFSQADTLRQALRCFLAAQRGAPNAPGSYLGIAFLLWLAGETSLALLYAHWAQYLDPQDPRSNALVQALGRAAPTRSQRAGIDLDGLYEAIERVVMKQVKLLMRTPLHELHPLSERPEAGRSASILSQLQGFERFVSYWLEVLEQELDVSRLRLKMQPFYTFCKRFETFTENRQRFRHVELELDGARVEVKAFVVKGLGDRELEPLLDLCDSLADRLDALESQGYALGALHNTYRALLKDVALLQDLLDERG